MAMRVNVGHLDHLQAVLGSLFAGQTRGCEFSCLTANFPGQHCGRLEVCAADFGDGLNDVSKLRAKRVVTCHFSDNRDIAAINLWSNDLIVLEPVVHGRLLNFAARLPPMRAPRGAHTRIKPFSKGTPRCADSCEVACRPTR